VLRRRGPDGAKPSEKGAKASGKDRAGTEPGDDESGDSPGPAARTSLVNTGEPAPNKPAPGARPVRHSAGRHARPTGKQNKR